MPKSNVTRLLAAAGAIPLKARDTAGDAIQRIGDAQSIAQLIEMASRSEDINGGFQENVERAMHVVFQVLNEAAEMLVPLEEGKVQS